MDLGLTGKRVFISASVRGIGFATADVFMAEGANVIINGRDPKHLDSAAKILEERHNRKPYIFLGDMQADDDIKRLKNKLNTGLDIFVANLGCGKAESNNFLNVEEWNRFYDVNVISTVKILDNIHSILKRSEQPSVVLISSVVSKEASSAPIGYAAAKSGVRVLNKYLSRKWAVDGIRVNCVLPGNIYFKGGRWEELVEQDENGVREYIHSTVPMKRFGTPEEIADSVVFLSSPKSGFTTGAEVVVDGGQLGTI